MFGDDIDPEVIDELMLAADTDSNGEIDLEEFKVIMRQGHQQFGGITKAMLTLRVSTPERSASPPWLLHCTPISGRPTCSRVPHVRPTGNDRRGLDASDAAQRQRGD